MRQNLGKLDRIFRFVAGIWLLGFPPWFTDAWPGCLMLVIGLFLLFESFSGFCALHDWLGINNRHQ
jgi:uncharacterized membrane protein HdeD (DUF308 family)